MTSSLNSAMALDDSFMRSRSCWWRRCSEVDRFPESPVDLGEFVLCCAQADLEAFDFADPALAFSLGNASEEVVADLNQSDRAVWGLATAMHNGHKRIRGYRLFRKRVRKCRRTPCGIRNAQGTRSTRRWWVRGIP
jgi:hypothetical protein